MRPISRSVRGALALTAVVTATSAHSELFISEYVEGSSNNKAIEIYNPGTDTADLSDYQLQIYFNGSTNVGLTLNLSGNLAPQAVYVVAHSSAMAEILAVTNQTTGAGLFNGDDAIVLSRAGANVDVIGQIGVDPGTAWVSGSVSTLDHTLRRKAGINIGDTNGDDAFDPALEWDVYGINDISDLGVGGTDNGGGTPPEPVSHCGEAATLISTIQGAADASPLVGQTVAVEAVVTVDFQGSDHLRGFFLQEEDTDTDTDSSTSEGLFIYDNGSSVDVNVGDRVHVTGVVTEYFGLTELSSITSVEVCAQGQTVTPAVLTLPVGDNTVLETMEGMRVSLPQTLTVSENYNLGRYGQVLLSNGRLANPTNVALPGADAQAVMAQNALNQLLLDDGSSAQNPAVVPYPAPELTAANTLRSGDQVQNLEGVLYYGFEEYSLQPVVAPAFIATNARTEAPELQQHGNMKVASFNVLNFFNGDGQGAGFPTARGATTADELERQTLKIVSAIRALDADVVGLMELENDGFGDTSAIAELVQHINATAGDQYAYVNPGLDQVGGDAITVGIIYKTATVSLAGAAATLATYPFDDYNRQPLVQTFVHTASSEKVTVVVNHFKSKGCGTDADGANLDLGDGQGCWNGKRTEAAQALANWLVTDPTQSGVARNLIIGDLNAYAKEDPIRTLQAQGYSNLITQFIGADAYSYVFNGEAGYLDHALASADLVPAVVDVVEWHINADEPRVLDYNLEFKSAQQQVSWFAPDAYRSSDHDPVLVVLNLERPLPGDFNHDGECDVKDMLLLIHQLFEPIKPALKMFDLNNDGRINIADLKLFLKL